LIISASQIATFFACRKLFDYTAAEADLTAKLYRYQKETSMQPKCEWSFTAKPDFARICRELAAQGATIGRVSMKGEAPVTLQDTAGRPLERVRKLGAPYSFVEGTDSRWVVIQGDHVLELLAIAPVKVEGWSVPPAPLVSPSPGVAGAPAPEPQRFGIFVCTGQRSAVYARTFSSEQSAKDFLEMVSPAERRANRYQVRPLCRCEQKSHPGA
jgi:hypothetical protein